MEKCLCQYLPKSTVVKTDTSPVKESIFETVELGGVIQGEPDSNSKYLAAKNLTENGKEPDFKTSQQTKVQSPQNISYEFPKDDKPSTSASTVEASASKTLATEMKNWVYKKKLTQTEADIECLKQALNEQCNLRCQLSSGIQELKHKKEKLKQEIRKSFVEHADKRNRLIQEITDLRQKISDVSKSIALIESKNVELEIERQDTVECLRKSATESPCTSRSLANTVKKKSSDSNSSISSETSSVEPKSELSGNSYSELESSSGTTTEVESETPNQSNVEKEEQLESQTIKPKPKIPSHICLDLSFLESEGHKPIDSGFSEANNTTSKNSAWDSSTPSKAEYMDVFKGV